MKIKEVLTYTLLPSAALVSTYRLSQKDQDNKTFILLIAMNMIAALAYAHLKEYQFVQKIERLALYSAAVIGTTAMALSFSQVRDSRHIKNLNFSITIIFRLIFYIVGLISPSKEEEIKTLNFLMQIRTNRLASINTGLSTSEEKCWSAIQKYILNPTVEKGQCKLKVGKKDRTVIEVYKVIRVMSAVYPNISPTHVKTLKGLSPFPY